jgi:hypothetical protein
MHRANVRVLADCNYCDLLPISPIFLDPERDHEALYQSWIEIFSWLNCSVIFVSEDPISREECFNDTLA